MIRGALLLAALIAATGVLFTVGCAVDKLIERLSRWRQIRLASVARGPLPDERSSIESFRRIINQESQR